MKKLLLYFLLFGGLNLGGFSGADIPSQGLVESAQFCIEMQSLKNMVILVQSELLYIENGDKQTAQSCLDATHDILDTSYYRSLLSKCTHWLKEPCFSEAEATRLLDEIDRLQNLYIQSARQLCNNDTGYRESVRQAKELVAKVNTAIPSLKERWNASIDKIEGNSVKAQIIREFQTIFGYLYDVQDFENEMFQVYWSVLQFRAGLPQTSLEQISRSVDSLSLTADSLNHRFSYAPKEYRLFWDMRDSHTVFPLAKLIEETQKVIKEYADSPAGAASALVELYDDFVDTYTFNLRVMSSEWDIFDLFRELLNPIPESKPKNEDTVIADCSESCSLFYRLDLNRRNSSLMPEISKAVSFRQLPSFRLKKRIRLSFRREVTAFAILVLRNTRGTQGWISFSSAHSNVSSVSRFASILSQS